MGASFLRYGIVLLFAFNLRSNLANFAPLVTLMSQEMLIGPVAMSLVGFLPPAGFALAAFLGQPITSRFGLYRTTQLAMWAVILGSVARALAPGIVSFSIATAIALAGAGLGNVLLPIMTREVSGRRTTQLSAANGIVFSVATAIPIFVALPLADVIGWRGSLGVWALPAAAFLLFWRRQNHLWKTHEPRVPDDKASAHFSRQLRSGHAWLTGLVFGMAGFVVYSVFIWFPIFLTEAGGLEGSEAANAISAFALAGVLISAFIPLSSKLRTPASAVMGFGFVLLLAFLAAVLVAPTNQLFWWFVLGGIGPIVFPVILISIARQNRASPSDVGFSSFVQGMGYLIGSVGPIVTGALYARWQSPVIPLVVLGGCAVVGLLLVVGLHIFGAGSRKPL